MFPLPSPMLLSRSGAFVEYLAQGAGADGYDNFGGLGGEHKPGTAALAFGTYAITVGTGVASIAGVVSAAKGLVNSIAQAGANGPTSSITGSAVIYGSSGGGGGFTGGSGAGNGGASPGAGGTAAAANRGGGGGGAYNPGSGPSGAGGTGIVVIRYLTGSAVCSGGTVTVVGAWTIHTFTSSGTFTVL